MQKFRQDSAVSLKLPLLGKIREDINGAEMNVRTENLCQIRCSRADTTTDFTHVV
jgi:hypothetical protein